MAYIEGIGDDLVTGLFLLITIVIVVVSWLSTNVRDLAFPANVFVIERRSRRLYTTDFNGNFNRIIASQRLAPSSTQTTSTTTTTPGSSSQTNSESLRRSDTSEVVDEIVEQALVENLLEGNLYSATEISPEIGSNNSSSGTQNTTQNLNSREVTDESSSNLNVPKVKTPESIVSTASELTPSSSSNELTDSSTPMNILIRFVNEKEMKIKAKPEDTILLLKRTHFGQELSSNKIVRFIYQGQFLCDKNTVKSYNIKDQTTIHCHITSKQQPVRVESTPAIVEETATNNGGLRQRLQTHQIQTIARMTGITATSATAGVGEDQASINSQSPTDVQSRDPTPQASPEVVLDNATPVSSNQIGTGTDDQTPVLQLDTTANGITAVISIDLRYLLLPLFAVVISSLWYFRINFKHFFSPLSTLILFVFTFVYGIFLVNNINSSSILAAATFIFNNRIWRNNRSGYTQN